MFALPITLLVFGLILVMARLKVPLAGAIVAGTGILGFAFGVDGVEVPALALAAATDAKTVALVLLTLVLLGLTGAMQSGGQMERIVSLTRQALGRPAAAMVALPAMVGMLPMPGGAVFSAPMVETAAAGAGRARPAPALLSAINYWYRHVWEYWWPLYPGVLLAVTLTEFGWARFAAFQLPLTVFMAAGGLVILRAVHPDLHARSTDRRPGTRRRLLRATSSIWIILLVWAATRGALTLTALAGVGVPPIVARYGAIAAGLVVSLAWTARLNGLGAAGLGRAFAKRNVWAMAVLVLCVMAFQYVLRYVHAAERIEAELLALRVPVVLMAAALPFIAGMVMGLAVGFVGTTFPLLLPLVLAAEGAGPLPAYVALAYAFGHMGQMLSPMHLCHVVSNRYFGAGFAGVYRYIVPAAAIAGAGAVGYFFALRAVLS
jgi:hypothetical protein